MRDQHALQQQGDPYQRNQAQRSRRQHFPRRVYPPELRRERQRHYRSSDCAPAASASAATDSLPLHVLQHDYDPARLPEPQVRQEAQKQRGRGKAERHCRSCCAGTSQVKSREPVIPKKDSHRDASDEGRRRFGSGCAKDGQEYQDGVVWDLPGGGFADYGVA